MHSGIYCISFALMVLFYRFQFDGFWLCFFSLFSFAWVYCVVVVVVAARTLFFFRFAISLTPLLGFELHTSNRWCRFRFVRVTLYRFPSIHNHYDTLGICCFIPFAFFVSPSLSLSQSVLVWCVENFGIVRAMYMYIAICVCVSARVYVYWSRFLLALPIYV